MLPRLTPSCIHTDIMLADAKSAVKPGGTETAFTGPV